MFRAVGVLVIFTFQKSFVNCFPDLTPEAITVYRNPEFFKNLPYYNTDETTPKTSQDEETEEHYKYPGETTRPNKSGDTPGFEVTYDDSPEFHHDPRDITQTPFRPSRRKGPYGPVYGGQSVSEENTTENYDESLPDNSEKSSYENLNENTDEDADDNYTNNSYENSRGNLEEDPDENYTRSSSESSGANLEDSENNYSGNSYENSGANLEENTEDNYSRNSDDNSEAKVEEDAEVHTPEDSNEYSNRNVHTDEDVSEENAEKTSRYADEDVSADRSSEEESREGVQQERNEDYNSDEYSEESQTTSPRSFATSDEELEAETEATLSIQPLNPDRISEVPKSIYNQPYPFNATYPILYDNWKHYNYPKISRRDFEKSDFVPLHGADASSNVRNGEHPSSDIGNDDDEGDDDSLEDVDTNNMGTDTKRIYKKLLRHKKLKPSVLFKYHSKPKLKKLKLKLKNGKHDSSWFDLNPFNF